MKKRVILKAIALTLTVSLIFTAVAMAVSAASTAPWDITPTNENPFFGGSFNLEGYFGALFQYFKEVFTGILESIGFIFY
ncbi:MAG: hypothetical protein LBT21_01810 [Oscillospiraceae bacterium]|nr:hypothetical protein [Oscillospiraceae bacterium]